MRLFTSGRTPLLLSLGATLGAGVWLGGIVSAPRTVEPQEEPSPVIASAAGFRRQETPPPAALSVTVDAESISPAAPDALRAALEPAKGTAARPDVAEPASAAWHDWARLGGGRAAVRSNAAASDLSTYAVVTPEGAAVVLYNRSGHKIGVRLAWRMSSGVYRFERLALNADGTAPHYDRLTGQEASLARPAGQPITLEPGQIVLLRASDTARAAREARLTVYDALSQLGRKAPSTANRLRRTLDRGRAYVFALSGNGRNRVGSLHCLLLHVAQAQSIARNQVGRPNIPDEPMKAVAENLGLLSDAVSETSATLLRLTPRLEEGDPENTARAGVPRLVQDGPRSELVVTVSLTNGGRQSVANVKLALDPETLPEGVKNDPAEPAFFGTLPPGQTVRASYRLRGAPEALADPGRLAGRVTYFLGGTPALLRPALLPGSQRP